MQKIQDKQNTKVLDRDTGALGDFLLGLSTVKQHPVGAIKNFQGFIQVPMYTIYKLKTKGLCLRCPKPQITD